MSLKGGAYVQFQRALDSGNPLIALTAAQELPHLSLPDALALTLALRSDPRRYERASIRWHARFLQEVPGVRHTDALLTLAALGSIAEDLEGGAQALAAVCERYGRQDLAEVVDRRI